MRVGTTGQERELEAAVSDPESAGILIVRTGALRNFPELVMGLGGDPDALLRKARIDPAILENRNAVISYRAMVQLLERAAVELHCPDFGMRLAASQEGIKVLGPLEVVMRHSQTLGEAFRYCADHVQAYSTATQICIESMPADHSVFMRFEILLARLPHQRQAVEHALLLTQQLAMSISSGRARAREVWFTHEPVAPHATYHAKFNATLRFGQRMNGLFFRERDFDLSIPDTDPQLYEIATSFIDHRFPSTALSLCARVRTLVGRFLEDGNCTHERIASMLGLHPRTLQRRLREEGKTFEEIKDLVRRDAALRYLMQRNIPLIRVAEILGYSETSVLSRSCYRWFAASPRQLRNQLEGNSMLAEAQAS
jgi:AraC-like DNA-binding protein